jgi:hypothetical protein
LINVLRLPLYLRDIVFLGHVERRSPLNGAPGGGLLALATYAVIVTAGLVTLFRRYRWVER